MGKILQGIFLIVVSFICAGAGVSETLTLPKPTGIYSVGTKAIELLDPSHTMLRGNDPRRFMAQVFYPAKKHDGTYPYMPNTLEDGVVRGVKVLAFSKPNAEPLKSQKFPVILSVPGRGGERQKETILYEELASQGYIVLAVDQPYVANFVRFPDGSKIVITLKDAWKVPRDRDYRYAYDDAVIDGSIQDLKYILDHLADINVRELGGLSDSGQIILMGHSLGGNVAHTLGFQDERIKAVVDIDSKITERKIFGRVGVPPNLSGKPVLFIRGMMQYQEDVGDQLNKIQNATLFLPFVQHSAFSDDAYFAAKIDGFGSKNFFSNLFNWFFKRGPYWDAVDTNLGGKDVDAWFSEYRSYVVDWLNKTVRKSQLY